MSSSDSYLAVNSVSHPYHELSADRLVMTKWGGANSPKSDVSHMISLTCFTNRSYLQGRGFLADSVLLFFIVSFPGLKALVEGFFRIIHTFIFPTLLYMLFHLQFHLWRLLAEWNVFHALIYDLKRILKQYFFYIPVLPRQYPSGTLHISIYLFIYFWSFL